MHVDTLLRQAALESAWLDREHCLSLHVVGSQLAGWLSADASLMDNLHPTVAEARGNILTGYKAKFSGYKTRQMETLILWFFILMTNDRDKGNHDSFWEAKDQKPQVLITKTKFTSHNLRFIFTNVFLLPL